MHGMGLSGLGNDELSSLFQGQSPFQALAHVQKLRFRQHQQQQQLQLQLQQHAAAGASLALRHHYATTSLATTAPSSSHDSDVSSATHAFENSLTTSPTGSASAESGERTPEAKRRHVTSSNDDTSPSSSDEHRPAFASPPVFPGLHPELLTSPATPNHEGTAMTSPALDSNRLIAKQMAALAAQQSLQLLASASKPDPVSMAMLGKLGRLSFPIYSIVFERFV